MFTNSLDIIALSFLLGYENRQLFVSGLLKLRTLTRKQSKYVETNLDQVYWPIIIKICLIFRSNEPKNWFLFAIFRFGLSQFSKSVQGMTEFGSVGYFFGKFSKNLLQLDRFIAPEVPCILYFIKVVEVVSEIRLYYVCRRYIVKAVNLLFKQKSRNLFLQCH